MEYLLVHRGKRGQSFEYELLYQHHQADKNQLTGLIEVEKLSLDKKKSGVKTNQSGQIVEKSPPSRPQVGGMSPPSRGKKIHSSPEPVELNGKATQKTSKMHVLETSPLVQSYGNIEERAEEAAEIVGGLAG
jgi:hypothetical protein